MLLGLSLRAAARQRGDPAQVRRCSAAEARAPSRAACGWTSCGLRASTTTRGGSGSGSSSATALIVSAPIISRTVAGPAEGARRPPARPERRRRDHRASCSRAPAARAAVPFRVDERVLKPRVGGLHRGRRLAHVAVEDAGAAGHAHADVLDADRGRRPGRLRGRRDAALDRARRRGAGARRAARAQRRVAARARVRRRRVPAASRALCPMCHLDVVVLRGSDGRVRDVRRARRAGRRRASTSRPRAR